MSAITEIHPDTASSLTHAFWDGCRSGKLLVPFCRACGRHFFRPEVACLHCFTTGQWDWVESAGVGTLYSYSIVHRSPKPGIATPFVFAAVDVKEANGDVWSMISNLLTDDLDGIRIGMPLQVAFDTRADGVVLPRFRPA